MTYKCRDAAPIDLCMDAVPIDFMPADVYKDPTRDASRMKRASRRKEFRRCETQCGAKQLETVSTERSPVYGSLR